MPRIAVVFFMFLLVSFTCAVASCDRAAPAGPASADSRLTVFHDPETGCEYLRVYGSRSAGLTPRLNRSGKPICRAHDQE